MTALPLASAARTSQDRTVSAQTEPVAAAVPQEDRFRSLQVALYTLGGVLMPLGLVAIFLGWYGSAHAKYSYDQFPYLISGGMLGLGFAVVGGFLYFGACLAKIGRDQQASSQQVADALLQVAAMVALSSPQPAASEVAALEDGAEPVLAGGGRTVHRRDCTLISQREDLRPMPAEVDVPLTACRVCRPQDELPAPRRKRAASKAT